MRAKVVHAIFAHSNGLHAFDGTLLPASKCPAHFLGQKNFFFCSYVMASRTHMRCHQQLLQTSSSQKLLHLQAIFFAHI
jgi:hypothetical protein